MELTESYTLGDIADAIREKHGRSGIDWLVENSDQLVAERDEDNFTRAQYFEEGIDFAEKFGKGPVCLFEQPDEGDDQFNITLYFKGTEVEVTELLNKALSELTAP